MLNRFAVLYFALLIMPLSVYGDTHESISLNTASTDSALVATEGAKDLSPESEKSKVRDFSEWRTRKDAESSTSSSVMRMLQGLGLCVGVFLILAWAYRRMALKGGSIPQRRITVLEKASITSKSSLILAEVDGQRVLLVAGAEQVTPVEYVNFNSCESSGLDSQFETAEVQCVEEIKLSA